MVEYLSMTVTYFLLSLTKNFKNLLAFGESTSMVWPTLGSRTAKEQEQLAFGEDMDRSIVSCFLTHSV